MNIEEILDMMEETLDKSWNLPLSGGKSVVDVEKVRDMMDDIRLNMPTEVKQAKSIVADRSDIIASAKRESENIIKRAEAQARAMVASEEIMKQAQLKANEMISNAQIKSREMRQAANDYGDAMMRRCEEALASNLSDLKVARQAIKHPKTPSAGK